MTTSFSRKTFLSLAGGAFIAGLVPLNAYPEESAHSNEILLESALNELSDDATYEDYRSFASAYLEDMPNPERMITNECADIAPRARITSPYWSSSYRGVKTFYSGDGNVFLDEAIKVIDVSYYQGQIDWSRVPQSGVDAAILRLGYGIGNEDKQFSRNVSECKRYGIPFGVYLYSYAYDSEFANNEAGFVASTMQKYGLDKDMPIFYDLEKWQWNGHTPPTDPSVYESIVRAFFDRLGGAGYSNLHVYSYKYYIETVLNTSYIRQRTSWVARYNYMLGYDFSSISGVKGWQYSSSGSVAGISGSVDMNAFSLVPYWKERISTIPFVDVYPTTAHYQDILWLAEMGISKGWEDGTFRPNASIARGDMAAFLYRLAGSPSYSPSEESKGRFRDVYGNTAHHDAIWWLGDTGISKGWEDGTFRPNSSIARGDMAAFLHRFAEIIGVGIPLP